MTATPTEPSRLSATEAVAAFKSGALTVTAYAESLLARIAARDATVKAWAHLDPAAVLAEAKRLDALDELPAVLWGEDGARGEGRLFAAPDVHLGLETGRGRARGDAHAGVERRDRGREAA